MARWVKHRSALGLTLALVAGPALAADDRTDVSRGHDLARAWCATCHSVEANDTAEGDENPPSFRWLAGKPDVTETALRVFLQTPHPVMPQIKLRPDEIDEIVAYILSLKDK